MNDRFFALPLEKQQAIINAGYRVFSQNSYKNSPMSEIADAAGISKSLLFHYFRNKKELYLFLWDKCAETTIEYLTEYGCYGQTALFESLERGMRAKMEIIRLYPDMGTFTIKAFYEKDEATTIFLSSHVLSEIQRNCTRAAIIRDGRIIACDNVDALSKTSAKRITVHGQVNLNKLDGVRDRIESGNSVSFLFGGDINDLIRALSTCRVSDLSVTEPDLEDIFLHYYEKDGDTV